MDERRGPISEEPCGYRRGSKNIVFILFPLSWNESSIKLSMNRNSLWYVWNTIFCIYLPWKFSQDLYENIQSRVLFSLRTSMPVMIVVVLCAIWYHSYNLKNTKNTHGRVFKSNTPPWMFFTFFKLCTWY